MGKHFDTLVEIVKREELNRKPAGKISDVQNYLARIVDEAALFELPIASRQIREVSGKEFEQYQDYLQDFLKLCAKYNKHLLFPFRITAIEDEDSVTILDPIQGANYRVIDCKNKSSEPGDFSNLFFSIGSVYIEGVERKDSFDPHMIKSVLDDDLIRHTGLDPDNITLDDLKSVRFQMLLETECYADWHNSQISYYKPEDLKKLFHTYTKNVPGLTSGITHKLSLYDLSTFDLISATDNYLKELAYIMDPEQFILRKESNQSMVANRKKGNKDNKKLRKTVLRPHYLALGEEDTGSFLKGESSEPRVIHPVRGHWRKLMSEKYTKMKGETIHIPQHYRGTGIIDGKNGWHYQVLLKKDDLTLQSYER